METVADKDTKTRVLEAVRAHPGMTVKQLAVIAGGVTPQRVHQILQEAGYRTEWRKAPKGKD